MKKIESTIGFILLLFTFSDLYSNCSIYPYESQGILICYQVPDALILESGSLKDLSVPSLIPIFMIVAGISIAGIWTADIVTGKFTEQGSLFEWREGQNLLWPHISAELIMSICLVIGGMGLVSEKEWGLMLSLVSLGALVYSALNSSSWVLAAKGRLKYGIPIWISLVCAILSIIVLIKKT